MQMLNVLLPQTFSIKQKRALQNPTSLKYVFTSNIFFTFCELLIDIDAAIMAFTC